MGVFKRGPRWTFRVMIRGRRLKRGGFPTKRLAELAQEVAKRRLLERHIEHVWGVRAPALRAAPTLRHYLDTVFFSTYLPRLAPTSQATLRSQLSKVTDQLGDLPLTELVPALLDRYAARRLQAVRPGMVVLEAKALSRVLNHAQRSGVILSHPMRGWRWPTVPLREYRIVTEAEEFHLLEASPQTFRPWIQLALATGLRKGELQRLERTHLDLHRAELRLQQPKTRRVKVIPLAPWISPLLAALARRDGRWLLGSDNGTPRSSSWINAQWWRTLKGADLMGVRFHDLRHTFASRLAEAGVSVPVVGELLGHTPPYKTTLRYFHPLPEAKRAAILKLRGPQRGPTRRKRVRAWNKLKRAVG